MYKFDLYFQIQLLQHIATHIFYSSKFYAYILKAIHYNSGDTIRYKLSKFLDPV